MARQIQSRLKISGELIAETPLHVGGYGESFETDLTLARNGKDEFYVPGTSVTGSLRSWFRRSFGEDETIQIWGFQETDKAKIGIKADRSKASLVLIEDLTLSEQVQSELRDGVGIDRVYGAAADKIKFDRAILPKGTRLKLEINVDIQENSGQVKQRFESLLAALHRGQVRVGASKTRGLGKVKCETFKIEEYSYDSFEGILGAVEQKPSNTYQISKFKGVQAVGAEPLTINIKWKPKSALIVKAGYDGIGVDMLPLVSANGKDHVSLLLPGSSIKGAFRAQAEKILRTLFDVEAPRDPSDNQNFSKQLRLLKDGKETKATELIGALFGVKKERDDTKQAKSTLGLGALSIDDCYAQKAVESNLWSHVETGELKDDATYSDQPLWHALRKVDINKEPLSEEDKKADTETFKISHHVAIDRWTGGAADGALYSVLQPTVKIGWDDLCLTLDLSRLCDADSKPDERLRKRCLMLLLLVMRDFAENRLPLGFATNRGMGEVENVSFKVSGTYEIEWKDGKFDFTRSPDLKEQLESEWKTWLDQN